jgi:D-lyxose ketol-isomerase
MKMKKKLRNSVTLGVVLLSMVACTGKTSTSESACGNNGQCSEQCKNECNQNNCKNKKEMTYSKKYTNADFYKDGKFQQEVAMEAMKDMFAFYDVPFTELMAKDMWVTDFGLGDFENVGMGGIFWVNNAEQRYFAHAIYLLPGQMIPEHAHVATTYPAKHESWMVEKGWAYNFSEVGDETPNAPAIPATHGPIKSKNFVVQKVGEVLPLKALTTFHFLMAGPEGAIVSEWATYHDNAGLRFSNPKAAL